MGNRNSLLFALSIIIGCSSLNSIEVKANLIQSASDGTGTNVNYSSNTYFIQGGTQAGNNLFHSFQEFGLSAGEIAHFLSQPHIDNILARVIGGNPSLISGLLKVSGGNSHLYLMNPAGIVFGVNASLNIPGDFFATTATGIGFEGGWFNAFGNNDYPTLIETPSEFAFDREGTTIINAGNLNVTQGQNITLLAGSVINTGQLSAPEGNITIAAIPGSDRVRIAREGYLLSLEILPPRDESGQVVSFDVLQLPELLTGKETGLTVRDDGTVRLRETIIPQETGVAIVSGKIDVGGNIGGNVEILGERIGVLDAAIDASGTNDGGNVRIGGDYRGEGDIPNAKITLIDEGTAIAVDALSHGNGGRVILWADETTAFRGHISARGGEEGGDGGFVETSGKQDLIFRGDIDVGATQGNKGNIFLDPQNINIVAGAAGSSPNDGELGDNEILNGDSPGGLFTISTGTLESLTGTIRLEATQNINLQAGASLNFTSATSITFTANADNIGVGNFLFFDPTDTITLNNANLTIEGTQLELGNINASGGNITLSATDQIDLNANIETTTGNIAISSTNNIEVGNNLVIRSNNGNVSTLGTLFTGANTLNVEANNGTVAIDTHNNPLSLNNIGISAQNLTVRASTIDTAGNIGVTGTGQLNLEPGTATQNLTIGATGISELDLTIAELAFLQTSGFTGMTIGRSDGMGNTILSDPSILTLPTNIIGAADLIGPNQNTTWTLTGSNSGSLSGFANSLTFSNVAKITGGNANDTFAFTSGVNFNGNVDGGAGFNTLNYTNYGNSVSVDIANGTATGTLGIANINDVVFPSLSSSTTSSSTSSTSSSSTLSTSSTSLTLSSSTSSTSSTSSSSLKLSLPENLADLLQTRSLATLSASFLDLDGNRKLLILSREQIGNLLDRSDIEGAIGALDSYHSHGFLRHFGKARNLPAFSLEELQSTLRRMSEETGETTATLYLFSRQDRLDILLVPPTEEPIHYSLPEVSREILLDEIGNLQNAIAHPLHRRNTRYRASAEQLHKWLISPAEKDLEHFGIETIMFVLDDGLRTLPLATLHDGDRFLIEKYALSLIPSLYFVAPHYVDVRNSSVVAMGMSEFMDNEALPAVPVEVDTIAQKFNAPETFLNETFTLNALQQEPLRKQAQIVHLATHGQFQPGTPAESYIQLWDRSLTLEDMGALNWGEKNIELLVLSACRTAFGDTSAEYGFAGLTVQSGVSSAVASLWYANDAGTLALMTEFYRQLRQKPTKAQALRQAQIALIQGKVRLEKENRLSDSKESGELVSPFERVALPPELANLNDRSFQHPYYWSGFTMIGSPW